ncbi:MAG: 30S ribosomal protein S16 [bacterium]|nr:30S ribosomal protein S16 [bacterium]
MLVVRLKRIGKKNQPTYRIVVAEHSGAVNGPFVEDIGFYNPHTKTISVDQEAVIGWMNKGAKPSNRVARLLEKEKVKHKSVVVIQYHKASKKKVEETKPAPKAETAEAVTEESAETPAEGETPEIVEETPAETSEEAVINSDETPAVSEEAPTEESAEETEHPSA